MKKTMKVMVSILVLLIIVCAFVGCEKGPQTTVPENENPQVVIQEGNAVVVVAVKEYMDKAKDNYLKSYLDVLVEEKILTYTGKEDTWGIFVTEVNGITTTKTNEFWGIYTSDEENANREYGIEYNSKFWYQTNFGISQMPIKENVQYLFIIQTW